MSKTAQEMIARQILEGKDLSESAPLQQRMGKTAQEVSNLIWQFIQLAQESHFTPGGEVVDEATMKIYTREAKLLDKKVAGLFSKWAGEFTKSRR